MSEDIEESEGLAKVEGIPSASAEGSGDPILVNVPLSDLADPREVRDWLSGREWVAVCFAAALLALIVIICGTLLWEHHVQMPQTASAADQKTAIENYKALTALVDERTERFFDLFVTKALLPVFTTLIGFLLGRRSRED